jgi:hypothetical protein
MADFSCCHWNPETVTFSAAPTPATIWKLKGETHSTFKRPEMVRWDSVKQIRIGPSVTGQIVIGQRE